MQKEAPSQSTGQKVDHILGHMDSNVFRLEPPIIDGASVQCSYTLPVCVYTVLIIVSIITHSAYKYYMQYCQAREYFHLLGNIEMFSPRQCSHKYHPRSYYTVAWGSTRVSPIFDPFNPPILYMGQRERKGNETAPYNNSTKNGPISRQFIQPQIISFQI